MTMTTSMTYSAPARRTTLTPGLHPARPPARCPAPSAPPVLLAGEDEETAADPHIVRGID